MTSIDTITHTRFNPQSKLNFAAGKSRNKCMAKPQKPPEEFAASPLNERAYPRFRRAARRINTEGIFSVLKAFMADEGTSRFLNHGGRGAAFLGETTGPFAHTVLKTPIEFLDFQKPRQGTLDNLLRAIKLSTGQLTYPRQPNTLRRLAVPFLTMSFSRKKPKGDKPPVVLEMMPYVPGTSYKLDAQGNRLLWENFGPDALAHHTVAELPLADREKLSRNYTHYLRMLSTIPTSSWHAFCRLLLDLDQTHLRWDPTLGNLIFHGIQSPRPGIAVGPHGIRPPYPIDGGGPKHAKNPTIVPIDFVDEDPTKPLSTLRVIKGVFGAHLHGLVPFIGNTHRRDNAGNVLTLMTRVIEAARKAGIPLNTGSPSDQRQAAQLRRITELMGIEEAPHILDLLTAPPSPSLPIPAYPPSIRTTSDTP